MWTVAEGGGHSMNEIIEGADIIVGMDVISQLREVTIYENAAVEFRGALCCKYATNSNDPREQRDKSV